MDTKYDIIPFDGFVARVTTIFEQVAAGKRVTVERNGTLFSVRAARRRQPHKPRGLTPEDPLLGIIGLGGIMDASGPTDVSANKHKYLAEAAADLHEPSPASGQHPLSSRTRKRKKPVMHPKPYERAHFR